MFSAASTLTIMVLSEKKVVDEFIGCWGVQWEASLPLTTEDGKVNLACYEL